MCGSTEGDVCLCSMTKRAHQNTSVPHKARVSVSSELGGGVGLCGPLSSVNLNLYSTRTSEKSIPAAGNIQRPETRLQAWRRSVRSLTL